MIEHHQSKNNAHVYIYMYIYVYIYIRATYKNICVHTYLYKDIYIYEVYVRSCDEYSVEEGKWDKSGVLGETNNHAGSAAPPPIKNGKEGCACRSTSSRK